jgi:hypothetical protein
VVIRRLFTGGRSRALCAGAGAVLAGLAVAALPGGAGAATSAPAGTAPVRVSAAPLGVDIAPWDPVYSNPTTFNRVQPLLKAAGFNEIHYSGGVTADQYDWQTNTDISQCPSQTMAEYTVSCAITDALSFSLLSQHARDLGAQTFATVNYGTGTPALAAAWVAQAAATPGQAVSDWEIGNESYGCWMQDNWLAQDPEDYVGYVPNSATCPMSALGQTAGMTVMANSYAANAGAYMTAMKAADPNAQLGVPWAFDGTVGGAAVGGNNIWNDTILQADAANISFVDGHWYPFSFGGNAGSGGNPSAQQVIQSVKQIPSEYAKIRNTLNADGVGGAQVIIGETGVSYLATNVPCTPAGALFAAGDVLEWLSSGAQSVNWWPLDTDANLSTTCTHADEGMFTNQGYPTTPYYGYLLASALAQPNAQLSSLSTSSPDVLAFQSALPNGKTAVALINTNTGASRTVNFGSALTGPLASQAYSAASQNPTNSNIVRGTTTTAAIAGGITLPAESIVVLTERPLKSSALTMRSAGAGSTFKAGARVTLAGTLALNGAAAPAGVPVKVSRRAAGHTQVTLTVKTVAGGGFTVTDLPAASGGYTYSASYVSNSYVPAAANCALTVTAVKPALKLAVSAKSVKPGKKITVTATLGAPHVNRTLVIYAQVKGSARKVIKRAAVDSKGQLSVVFPVKANTTFTVTFAGDTWYTAGSATATVKA